MKLGYVMDANVCRVMRVLVFCEIQSALNVKEVFGNMVAESILVHFAIIFYAKMINLSIKRHVKSLKLRVSNVNHATNMDNIRVLGARLVTAMIMSSAKVSSKRSKVYADTYIITYADD